MGVVRMSPGVAETTCVTHVEHYIIITMVTGECQWSDLPLIKKMMTGCQSLYPVVRYAFTTIPTYPNGQIGMVLASINKVRMTGTRGGCVICLIITRLSYFQGMHLFHD